MPALFRTETPLTTGRCIACSAELSAAIGGLMTGAITPAPNPNLDVTRVSSGVKSGLGPGVLFAGRYRIERLLGVGGIGAVYRRGTASSASRWRQGNPNRVLRESRGGRTSSSGASGSELLLARQVTHKNVVRIHDLGESDGIKYITMPFVWSCDLHAILGSVGPPAVREGVVARPPDDVGPVPPPTR